MSLLLAALPAFLLASGEAASQWTSDPAHNTPVCEVANSQDVPVVAADGAGGAVIAWHDIRSATDWDIYAQHLDPSGALLWNPAGVVVRSAPGDQYLPLILSDDSGGAILLWQEGLPNADLYAQRISGGGTLLWPGTGTPVCVQPGEQENAVMARDAAGGAIAAWEDNRTPGADIYAQRVSASGEVLWTLNGVAVCTAGGTQSRPRIAADGAGGAFIIWQDGRSGAGTDVYAQWIDSAGSPVWAPGGVAVCDAPGNQARPALIALETGGCMAAWEDRRSGQADIYAQRLGASGVRVWDSSGVTVCPAAGDQTFPSMAPDDSGGGVVAWEDARGGAGSDIYAQRIGPGGSLLWQAGGVQLCGAPNAQSRPVVLNAGQGAATVVWQDTRTGFYTDVYAQRCGAAGAPQWGNGGLAVAVAPRDQMLTFSCAAADPSGFVFVTWADARNGNFEHDIYAQALSMSGNLDPRQKIVSIADKPADQGGRVNVTWEKMELDTSGGGPWQVLEYTVWRERPALGGSRAAYDSVAAVPAAGAPLYTVAAPTFEDSSAGEPHACTYLISAATNGPGVVYLSAPGAGYSVDNIAPGSPRIVSVQMQFGPSAAIAWEPDSSDADIASYSVYRSVTEPFDVHAAPRLGLADTSFFLDEDPPAAERVYYRVAAVDVHGNEGAASLSDSAAPELSTIGYSMGDGWNLVSIPAATADSAADVLFPSAVSKAFVYADRYRISPSMSKGPGYWLKFAGAQPAQATGLARRLLRVHLRPGWNLIGSIVDTVPAGKVVQSPPGILLTGFFGFSGSYVDAAALEAGRGYWVKARGEGEIVISGEARTTTAR